MNVLCISKLSYDILCPMDGNIEYGKKYYINERQECGGGEAANAAFLLGKWGVKTTIAGVVGSDDFATKIKKELQGVQADVSTIETSYEKPTILSFIPINKGDGQNTIIRTYRSDFAYLKKRDFGLTPDLIITDGHEYGATHDALERNQKAKSILCADKCTPEMLDLCKFAKYLICSLDFALTALNFKVDFNAPQTLVNLYQNLKNRFPNCEIIITLGNKGALYSVNGEIKVMPGINMKTVDLTGAGDAFRGAFAYALLNEFPIDKAVTYANIAAGLTISRLGSRQAFPSLNEVVNYYNQKFPPSQNAAQPMSSVASTPTPAQPNVNQVAAPAVAQVPQQSQTNTVPAAPQNVSTPNTGSGTPS